MSNEIQFLSRRDIKRATSSKHEHPKLKITDNEDVACDPNNSMNGGVAHEKGMVATHAVKSDGKIVRHACLPRRTSSCWTRLVILI